MMDAELSTRARIVMNGRVTYLLHGVHAGGRVPRRASHSS